MFTSRLRDIRAGFGRGAFAGIMAPETLKFAGLAFTGISFVVGAWVRHVSLVLGPLLPGAYKRKSRDLLCSDKPDQAVWYRIRTVKYLFSRFHILACMRQEAVRREESSRYYAGLSIIARALNKQHGWSTG
jgi:hypothetical protein